MSDWCPEYSQLVKTSRRRTTNWTTKFKQKEKTKWTVEISAFGKASNKENKTNARLEHRWKWEKAECYPLLPYWPVFNIRWVKEFFAKIFDCPGGGGTKRPNRAQPSRIPVIYSIFLLGYFSLQLIFIAAPCHRVKSLQLYIRYRNQNLKSRENFKSVHMLIWCLGFLELLIWSWGTLTWSSTSSSSSVLSLSSPWSVDKSNRRCETRQNRSQRRSKRKERTRWSWLQMMTQLRPLWWPLTVQMALTLTASWKVLKRQWLTS